MARIKELLALSPYLTGVAIVLGIIFDLGYFWAIDINFYTFFSIDEHLLFSIEALPFSILIVIAAFFIEILSRIEPKVKSALRSIGVLGHPASGDVKPISQSKRIWTIHALGFFALNIIFIAEYFLFDFYSKIAWIGFNFIFLTLMLSNLIAMRAPPERRGDVFIATSLFSCAPICIFLLGLGMGDSYINREDQLHSISGICDSCSIVRFGKNGILFTHGRGTLFFRELSDFHGASKLIK